MESKVSLGEEQNLDRDQRYAQIAKKVASRQAVTQVIAEERLPLFLKAASASGFKVEQIAKEGERFPGLESYREFREEVSDVVVQGTGNIAISIEKLEGGSKGDHGPFWKKLKSLKQKKA